MPPATRSEGTAPRGQHAPCRGHAGLGRGGAVQGLGHRGAELPGVRLTGSVPAAVEVQHLETFLGPPPLSPGCLGPALGHTGMSRAERTPQHQGWALPAGRFPPIARIPATSRPGVPDLEMLGELWTTAEPQHHQPSAEAAGGPLCPALSPAAPCPLDPARGHRSSLKSTSRCSSPYLFDPFCCFE